MLLPGAGPAGRGRDGEPDLGVFLAQVRDDRALADPGGP
ncbi:putative guanylate kinase [Streptomyces sp. Tu6071]|nr:putative guanylate kinase [Streptomyces sp. Tu6071]